MEVYTIGCLPDNVGLKIPFLNLDGLWKTNLTFKIQFCSIVLGAKIQNYYYRRKLSGQETHVEHLRKKQKLKVEELKKRTGYYVTKGLIERYDRNNTPVCLFF